MTRWTKIHVVALTGAAALAAWLYALRAHQSRELVMLEQQVRVNTQELESHKTTLAELEEQKNALLEHKKASTDSVLVPLMRERAEATSSESATQAAARIEKGRVYRRAMAATLDDPEQREINRQLLRNEIKPRIAPLVKKLGLSPEQAGQFLDLLVEHELQNGDRIAALLRETVSVKDALQQRDAAYQELQRQLRALLGEAGFALYDEGHQNAQKANVERVLNWLRGELGDRSLNSQQSARLTELIHAEFGNIAVDDTDAFRPARDSEQWMLDHQQNIIRQIAPMLTPEQLAAFDKLAAEDRSRSQEQLDSKRKAYGLMSN